MHKLYMFTQCLLQERETVISPGQADTQLSTSDRQLLKHCCRAANLDAESLPRSLGGLPYGVPYTKLEFSIAKAKDTTVQRSNDHFIKPPIS